MSGDIQISPHVGELFVKYGVRRQYRSGEVLLEKGALSAQAGFLVKGQLRTFCLGPSGDEISLFYLGPGNLFGSSALVYHAKVMVSVSAISPAEVYLLAADRFWKLWQEHGYPPQDLMAHFVRRITMLSDYICCSHFLEDDKRVAYFLHTCCASSGPSIPASSNSFGRPASSASLTAGSRFWPPSGCLRSLPPWDIFWTEPLSESAKNFSEKGLAFLAHWR